MRRVALAVITLAVGAAGVWWTWQRLAADQSEFPIPGEGDHVAVEVLNATGIDGLARAITRQLRHRGIDVVYFGTAPTDTLQTTIIAVRGADTAVAGRVRDALGVGRIVIDQDPRLLLDASVLLGRDAAPTGHFSP
ncbi:MAG: hypothetical protein GTN62_12175 [Gemmatimonadales bacterium]|nr:hypothetical protein [Gemmatimonadales bacterium]NIN12476.1 hypothetical protein [Gemmatimonadales bacterium]NIN50852.1 hypothetical protein [Gemmatimonadales bacterium]NIP08316.1 hypothetical protein [Gemmatimonadales bacterium]NIR00840.1 hypothetical protein [Gemmatimonadales bacterium]